MTEEFARLELWVYNHVQSGFMVKIGHDNENIYILDGDKEFTIARDRENIFNFCAENPRYFQPMACELSIIDHFENIVFFEL